DVVAEAEELGAEDVGGEAGLDLPELRPRAPLTVVVVEFLDQLDNAVIVGELDEHVREAVAVPAGEHVDEQFISSLPAGTGGIGTLIPATLSVPYAIGECQGI